MNVSWISLHRPDVLARFEAKIERSSECWQWTANTNREGYGTFQVPIEAEGRRQEQWMAHRLAYALWVGPIPEGYEVDHLCHNDDVSCDGGPTCPHRACVNPGHLEAVTVQTNVDRRRQFNAKKTHCEHGHALDASNTYLRPDGDRQCKTCRRQHQRDYRRRKAQP